MVPDKARRLVGGYDWKTPTFFKLFMPYCIQRVDVPGRKHAFLPLNRDYAPLGMRRGEHRSYEDMMPTHGVYFSRDPAKLEGIWHNMRGGQMWLYDDSVESRVDYFARLEKLMSRQMEMVA